MASLELGHTGFRVDDLEVMEDFYVRLLGLQVTDRDEDEGIVFFSSRPDVEHHELVLARGRTPGRQHAESPGPVAVGLTRVARGVPPPLPRTRRQRAAGGDPKQRLRHLLLRPRGQPQRGVRTGQREVRQPFRKSLHPTCPSSILAEAERLLVGGGTAYQPVR